MSVGRGAGVAAGRGASEQLSRTSQMVASVAERGATDGRTADGGTR